MPPILKIEDLTKEYRLGKVLVRALQGISLELEQGHFVAVVGPSGSGKTTLLNVVGTLDKPTSGKVYIDGEELTNQTEKELTRLRRKKIGFIFQFYNLIPVLTAFENVELPMIIAGLSRNEAAKRAQALLESTKLLDRAAHRPDELSGGEQQRIAIARALANRPSIILADEPTGDLDSATGKLVMRMLFEMSRQEKATVIVATHDPAVVDMADRLLRMKDGQVITDEKMSLQKGA